MTDDPNERERPVGELWLGRITLCARDPERLARWYGDTFGLAVRGRVAGSLGTRLTFEPGEPARAGGARFGLRADSAETVRAWRRRLGAPATSLEAGGDRARLRASDPEGNAFEIYWEPHPFAEAPVEVRAFGPADREWLGAMAAPVGGVVVVSRGRRHRLPELPGFVAIQDGARAGFAFHRRDGRDCELVAIEAVQPGRGVGTALLARVCEAARAEGCGRLWLVTTNDNLDALRFYQRRGLRLAAVHAGALARTRELKPELPEIGDDGIPLRDEIELELTLSS